MKGYLLIVGVLIVVISALITLNVFFQQSLQMDIAEQFNKQQLILAKSAASDMETCLRNQKEEIISFSIMMSGLIRKNRADLKYELDEYFRRKPSSKAKVAIFNKNGARIYSWQNGDIAAGKEHIKKAFLLSQGQSIVSYDSRIVYMSAPIYSRGELEGAILYENPISIAAHRFLTPIISGSKSYVWMIDKEGTLLYHPTQPNMIGGNVYRASEACFKCHMNFDLEKKIIGGKTSDFGRHIAPTGEDRILAFHTLNMDTISWMIVVSSPYSEISHVTKQSMRLYSYLIISIFITTSLVSSLLIVFNKKRIKAEEIAKREQELEKYALILESKVRDRTAELVSEKEKLNSIISAIGGGILLIDKNAKIQWANQIIKDMVGMEVVGKYCEELWADCDITGSYTKDNIETIILSAFLGQKDKYFQITTAPVKGLDGDVHGYIRLVQDVTEIKKMEEQIIHSEKLASIGRLAAGIAHEIGNPLTSIFSFVQILREMEDDSFKKESLETIYFHINRISEILKQLSGFSKMPAGEAKECRVNDIIETSINLIQYDKKAKNIAIVKDLSASMPEITADGNQLSQVFVNLTLNAIDAMQDGGTLTVKSMLTDGSILIQFKDTGTGIPKEDLPKIFDPFFTTKEKGTGLGLAVSYNIIKKMNGTLTVDSEFGKGTTFTITLPYRDAR